MRTGVEGGGAAWTVSVSRARARAREQLQESLGCCSMAGGRLLSWWRFQGERGVERARGRSSGPFGKGYGYGYGYYGTPAVRPTTRRRISADRTMHACKHVHVRVTRTCDSRVAVTRFRFDPDGALCASMIFPLRLPRRFFPFPKNTGPGPTLEVCGRHGRRQPRHLWLSTFRSSRAYDYPTTARSWAGRAPRKFLSPSKAPPTPQVVTGDQGRDTRADPDPGK
jgi:hypothetical protein